jgi:endonuclease/exonuclease/phosphatase (EEP) superfamily protein YafD
VDRVVLVVCWVFIAATALPLVRREAWWIRVFDFPRPQFTIALLACGASLGVWFRTDSGLHIVTMAALGACALYQLWEMSRYTRLRRVMSLGAEAAEPERRLRLLIANVLMTNRNVSEYLDLIGRCDPDIVVLAEPDAYWEEQLRQIESRYPHTMRCPLSNTYGLLLYSRLPLSDESILFRVDEDVPSFRATVTLRTGDTFEMHAIHPRPPHVGHGTHRRDAELVLVAKEVKDLPRPVIVTGDLNDVAWSHTTRLFLRISGLLDPRLGRTFCNTFHARYALFRWPLDHVFHSRAFRLVRLERGPKTASDHFPVFVELSFEPEKRTEQERPTAAADDWQEAERKLESAKTADAESR